jgi:predicted AlkP superfamily pyrophosphatase or phosphodiesterase
MRGRQAAAVFLFAAALGAAACAPARKYSPVPLAPARASRAVLLSIDGMSGERLARLLADRGKLPAGGLAGLVETGFFAVRSVPCTPSLTPAAHATHVTGALPRETGIVGNVLLDPEKPFGARRSGFDTPLRAETLCEGARRQGKRVGVMAYPHAAGTPDSGCAGFGMNWISVPAARPRLTRLSSSSWSDSAVSGEKTFSPARRAVLEFPPTSHKVSLVALDSTDDGKLDYDGLRVEPDVGAAKIVAAGDSFPVEVRGKKGRSGAWCKLLSLASDLSAAEIYCGGIWESDAWPDDFRRDLDERAGFWPGRADSALFGARSEHPEIYMEQSDRLTEFLTKADLAALARPDWDLLFLYQSEVDAVEHEFLLADPRQQGYTRQRAARYAGFVDDAYADADRAVARFRSVLTPADALFVTSDHGMTPLWTEIYLAEVFVESGLLRVTPDGGFDPSSAAVAMASSGIGHVYVNPKAPPGTIDRVERLLADFRVAGESPWDRLVRRSAARDLGLDAPESGDLIVLAKPGVHFSMRLKPGLVSGPAEEYGGHGYRAAYPDLDASFLAAGAGVQPGRVEEMPSDLIASRVAAALRIVPPRQARR